MPPVIIHWFRHDLRLGDNPAFAAAAKLAREQDGVLLPVFVFDQAPPQHPIGGASRWWLHHSLNALAAHIQELGGQLLLLQGDTVAQLTRLAQLTNAQAITHNHVYDQGGRLTVQQLAAALATSGNTQLHGFDGNVLYPPNSIHPKTPAKDGAQGFQVFTPFWRAVLAAGDFPAPIPQPPAPRWAPLPLSSDLLNDWRLLPTNPDWAKGFAAAFPRGQGEVAAKQQLQHFLNTALANYDQRRDIMGENGTSRLSPYLSWGELSPRQIAEALVQHAAQHPQQQKAVDKFLAELGWREFSCQLLVNHPHLPQRPLRPSFDRFPWQPDAALLQAWQRGLTGYPIVDAGMRELWTTGWQHNRVRMITASFLIKHLLQPWQAGEAWFWDTLVDADAASNAASWQWVAGCGADAAPYFRIFNPILQGQKFDADGHYIRRWLPELARLPNRSIHQPWNATPLELAAAGVKLGGTGQLAAGYNYPLPIIDHDTARQRALTAFQQMQSPQPTLAPPSPDALG
jgi:deoxyribodipyrimidine photo-lyase